MNPKALWELLRDTFNEWNEDKASRLAAALAYYTIFSIAPLLIIAIAIAGAIFGQGETKAQILDQVQGLVGREGATLIATMIDSANKPAAGTVAAVIGIATLLFGAAGIFGQLKDALNTVWEVAPKPGRGILATIMDRFLSFTMVLGIGFLLMVSLVVSAGLAALSAFFNDRFAGFEFAWRMVDFVVSFGVITLLFAMIYRILPDVQIAWRDVWAGAAVTSLLFVIGKFLIGFYLGRSSATSIYGAAGSLVVVLLWIYYSAQILLFGAEFTQVWATKYGSQIRPEEQAVAVSDAVRAEQGMTRKEQVEAAASGRPAPVYGISANGGRHAASGNGAGDRAISPAQVQALSVQRYGAALLGFVLGFLVGTGARGGDDRLS